MCNFAIDLDQNMIIVLNIKYFNHLSIRFNKQTHCKACYDFVKKNVSENRRSFTSIYAYQPFTLRVCSGSHLCVAYHKEKGRSKFDETTKVHDSTVHDVMVNKGCFILFDSALIHAGTAFSSEGRACSPCYRVHSYYVTDKDDLPNANETYKKMEVCIAEGKECEKCLLMEKDTLLNILYDGKFQLFCYNVSIIFLTNHYHYILLFRYTISSSRGNKQFKTWKFCKWKYEETRMGDISWI